MKRLTAKKFIYFAILNFFLCAVVAGVLGGEGLLGSAADGKYFLKGQSVVTEVSAPVFFFSKYYTLFSVFLMPIAFVIMVFKNKELK